LGYSIGIGLTNDCNLNCAHCYRDTGRLYNLTLEQIRQICSAIPVDAVGMGTGENILNPEFESIVRYLQDQQIKLSIASNGYTLTAIPSDLLKAFHDVEVSIDFASQAEQDAFRGEGNWVLVHQAIERCHAQGVEVSILATLMKTNYDQMDRLVMLARRNGVNLRVNAYQAVKTDAFRLTFDQFWEGYRRLFSAGEVISCSEPVVRAVLGLGDVQSPCGHRSLRFNPRGQLIPCVYWPMFTQKAWTIADLNTGIDSVMESESFSMARFKPPSASECPCQGGCASRRALNFKLDAHDDYCPWRRGIDLEIDWKPATAKDLMRSSNVCTTIVM
jgi:MoaA/NifB/PqqE/SkfB family radical SAM enzyme